MACALAAGTPPNFTVYEREFSRGPRSDRSWGQIEIRGAAYEGWALGKYVWVPERDGRDLFSDEAVLLLDPSVETVKYGLVVARTKRDAGPFLSHETGLKFEGNGDDLLARAVALLGEGVRPSFYDVE